MSLLNNIEKRAVENTRADKWAHFHYKFHLSMHLLDWNMNAIAILFLKNLKLQWNRFRRFRWKKSVLLKISIESRWSRTKNWMHCVKRRKKNEEETSGRNWSKIGWKERSSHFSIECYIYCTVYQFVDETWSNADGERKDVWWNEFVSLDQMCWMHLSKVEFHPFSREISCAIETHCTG